MSIKIYLGTLVVGIGGNDGRSLAATATAVAFLNGQPVVVNDSEDPLGFYGSTVLSPSDTIASIKPRIQTSAVEIMHVNSTVTVGEPVSFYWLDDKGLL